MSSIEDILDGLSLFREHAPQAREDWIGVVKRVYADGPPENPSPLFGALYDAWAEVERLRQGLWDICILTGFDHDGDLTPRHLAFPDIVDLALGEVRRLREGADEAADDSERLRALIGGLYEQRAGSREDLYVAIRRAFRAANGETR